MTNKLPANHMDYSCWLMSSLPWLPDIADCWIRPLEWSKLAKLIELMVKKKDLTIFSNENEFKLSITKATERAPYHILTLKI